LSSTASNAGLPSFSRIARGGEGEQAQGIAIGWLRPKLLLVTSA